jgi:hypothetical protein
MQVVSLAPVPVASVTWRIGDGAWSLGVVCKLTFQLMPGDARLAKRHDPIYERERFPDDDTEASMYAPCDLVPARPLTDVTLVGNAYAPRGTPVTTLNARLQVQTIDKSLVIDAVPTPRAVPFKSASLSYECAEPSPTNPLGVARDSGHYPHPFHIVAAIDPSATSPGHTSPGFGPIAGHWTARRKLLVGEPPGSIESGKPFQLPKGFELKYFNAAPPDQQLPELEPNAEIALVNLHPDEPVLHTRLPNVAPQVFVERRGESRREPQQASISGVWIDTRRSMCTITWHTQIRLEAADEPGRAWVAVAGPGTRLSGTQLNRLIGSLSRSHSDPGKNDALDEASRADGEDPMNRTVSIRKADRKKLAKIQRGGDEVTQTSVLSKDHVLATDDTQRGRTVAAKEPPPSSDNPSEPVPRPKLPRRKKHKSTAPKSAPPPTDHLANVIDPAERTADGIPIPASNLDDSPAWLAPGSRRDPSVPPPPPRRSRPASAPPSSPPSALDARAASVVPAPRAPAITHPGLGPVGPVSQHGWPTTHIQGSRDTRLADTSSLPTADPTASNGGGLAPHDKPREKHKRRVPDEVVELLWFDEAATPRLRRRWPKLCDRLDFEPRDDDHDLVGDDPQKARQHHTHFGVLTEAPTGDAAALRGALREAISEQGRFTPPLVLLNGELRFPFDAIEVLRATAATVKPVAGDDKKLMAALDQVDELLQTPLLSGNTETVANFTKHLRKLYKESRRSLSVNYLDDTVERMLLEQRRYQKRTLFGEPTIRALLRVGRDDKGIPTYLPEDLADKLPMMTTLAVRLIAEGHVRQDQYEAHPHALKVVTLGRVIRLD